MCDEVEIEIEKRVAGRNILETFAVLLETVGLLAAAAAGMRAHRPVLLLVDDLGRKSVGVALFDIFNCLQALGLVLPIVCALEALAPAAELASCKAFAVQFETS